MKIKINRPAVQIERCPYLGLHDDDSTALAYASPWNCCYHAAPPAPVAMEHQAQTCLCPGYVHCTVLLSNKWARLPRALRGRARVRIGNQSPRGRLVLIALALLAAVLLLLLGQLSFLWDSILKII